MRAGNGVKGIAANDWANPGKQTEGTQYTYDIVSNSSLPSGPVNLYAATATNQSPVQAKFLGGISVMENDTDGDGLYNYLTVSAQANVTNGGASTLLTLLNDNSGNAVVFANEPITLNAGVQKVIVNLDGLDIRAHGVDGPYNVTMILGGAPGDDETPKVDQHTSSPVHIITQIFRPLLPPFRMCTQMWELTLMAMEDTTISQFPSA